MYNTWVLVCTSVIRRMGFDWCSWSIVNSWSSWRNIWNSHQMSVQRTYQKVNSGNEWYKTMIIDWKIICRLLELVYWNKVQMLMLDKTLTLYNHLCIWYPKIFSNLSLFQYLRSNQCVCQLSVTNALWSWRVIQYVSDVSLHRLIKYVD